VERRGPILKLDRSIVFACIQQGAFLILGGLMLDFGTVLRSVFCSMLAYWMGVAFIFARRRDRITPSDMLFVRWGFLMLWTVLILIAGIIAVLMPAK
jgi:hypothetical protein